LLISSPFEKGYALINCGSLCGSQNWEVHHPSGPSSPSKFQAQMLISKGMDRVRFQEQMPISKGIDGVP